MLAENNMYEAWQEALLKNDEVRDYLSTGSVEQTKKIIEEMLIPDRISPLIFINNLESLGHTGISLLKPAPNPSLSMSHFYSPANRPPAFPLWFIIAYPDVLAWFQKIRRDYLEEHGRDYDGLAAMNAKLLYGIDLNDPNLSLENLPLGEFQNEKQQNTLKVLKKLTDAYREVSNKFETAF